MSNTETITFEFEFYVDHPTFKGTISCTKTVSVVNSTDHRKVYETLLAEAHREFVRNIKIVED
jgi:hypothetical protein